MELSLQKIFKIRDQELGKVLQFTLLGALLQAGLAIGISTADALFIVEVGSENLPIIYIALPFVMMVYTPIYSYLISRYGIDRVFDFTLITLAVGSVGFCTAFMLFSGLGVAPAWIFYAAKLYTWLWYIALYSLFWNFTDSYFDIQDGKRLFPLFSSGTAFGTSIGGGIVTVLAHIIPSQFLFLIWGGLAIATFPVLYRIKRRLKKLDSDEVEIEDAPTNFFQQNRQILSIILRSRYILVLTAIFFTTLIITTLDEYLYLNTFEERGSVEEIASLLGLLFLLTNIFNIVVNLFLFNRLVLSIGVINVALIQPTAYLITFLLFSLQGGYVAALFGFFAYQGILTSIEYNNQNFLFNAIPGNVKQQVRTFIEGLCEPMATVVIGVFLLIFSRSLSPAALSTVGLGLVTLFWILVAIMRGDYLQAMIHILRQGWLDFSQANRSVLHLSETDKLQIVTELSTLPTEAVLSALTLLWKSDRPLAARTLLDYLRSIPVEQWGSLKPIFSLMLSSQDYEIIRILYKWVDRQDMPLHPSLLEELGYNGLVSAAAAKQLLDDQDPDVRGAAIVISLNDWDLKTSSHALASLEAMLNGSEAEQRAAIRALGRSRHPHYTNLLLSYLSSSSGIIRQETLSAILHLASPDASRLLQPILESIRVGTSQERSLAMDSLMKISDSSCVPSLLSISDLLTPGEKRKAEDVILNIGLKSVPSVITILKDSGQSYEARSMAARILSRIAFAQFESIFPQLIDAEIQRAYRFLTDQAILQAEKKPTPGFTVLTGLYRDNREAAVSFILEMLTLGGRLPDFELLRASLRSDNPKERGNAIETIEQGVHRSIFQLLLPLIDSRSFDDRVLSARKSVKQSWAAADEIIAQALDSYQSLECAAATQILWDTLPAPEVKLRNLLHSKSAMPIVREAITSFLFREEHGTKIATELNIIEKIAHLSNGCFFSSLSIRELYHLSKDAEEIRYELPHVLYQPDDLADHFYYILSGTVNLDKSDRIVGQVAGEECLYGHLYRTQTAKTTELRALKLSLSHVIKAAETYPNIAIKLLENKMNVIHHV